MKKSEIIYQKGYQYVDQELDIISLLNTVNKLKAGLSTVIGDNEELSNKCRDMYIKRTTLRV